MCVAGAVVQCVMATRWLHVAARASQGSQLPDVPDRSSRLAAEVLVLLSGQYLLILIG